jgi:16S rRNA (guanine527-N7)-methyltransferase
VPDVSALNQPPLTKAEIASILTRCGLDASPRLVENIARYLSILQKWNSRINLTGLTNASEVVRTHFAESFLAARYIDEQDSPVLDIGSGAGFPGLAMKLYYPEATFYLLEARKKRAAFLLTVRRELGLSQLTILNKTLEECHESDFYPRPPGLLTLRALGKVKALIQLGLTLAHPQARVLLFPTRRNLNEIQQQLPCIRWSPSVAIPWSRERVIVLGSRVTGST